MQKLPIGIQTFKKIRSADYVYVDKTKFIYKLISEGTNYFFLSRPRRFGKSLFLSTLKEVFEGNKELFKGLYIYDKYDFTPHPVIRISFGSGDYSIIDSIYEEINYILRTNIKHLKVECSNLEFYKSCFKELIENTYFKYNSSVIVLIDEYDKPILDNILDKDKARTARDILKNFYSVLKDMIIEFKVDSKEDPIKQIEDKKYYQKYLAENKPIYLLWNKI
ncbi:Predicted AAA-ATPase [Desulfonauticus submarinus]|uniref:Predicted AAA-ATPase n=1 Tax=Desulfonauticus submarinus TaxID=206665 RepID=A0A1G9ZKC4_9BACT|nr:AAA family ATPase [Desulfonauticus submarinus]SDN21734.1 Predicted AAA-ATPase [Desulfonauticus submarinus]